MNTLNIKTNDTTLEALLTGQAKLACWRNWPHTEVLELADPFQNAVPCWQGVSVAVVLDACIHPEFRSN